METKLNELICELSAFKMRFVELSSAIITADNSRMYSMDLFSIAVTNRAIQIADGFEQLIKSNNYLCAIPLIRLQLDNALRFFATSLVTNRDDFFSYFLDGSPINKYKDANGKNLSDSYLANRLEELFPGVLNVYKIISSHIHLSDQHFFATKEQKTEKSKSTRIAIGLGADPFNIELKIDFVYTMIQVCKLVSIVVEQWKLEKENIGLRTQAS